MSDSRSEYEIRIKPKGEVVTTLVREGVTQTQACAAVLNLTRSMGPVTRHDERCAPDQPVNVGLNIPGLK